MSYLNKYKLINECQSSFWHKHSCQTALVKLIDLWMNCIDHGDLVGTMSIDFRKAFDMVDLSHFIRKQSSYKLSTLSFSLFTSYLDAWLDAIRSDRGLSEFS